MVNLSTPYPEMYRTIMAEFEKCGWWVEKFLRKQGEAYKRDVWMKHNMGQTDDLPVVEYKSPSGNRWMNYLYVSMASSQGLCLAYDSICYWECYGSFGAFIPYKVKGEQCLLVTTSHFWQRLRERTDYQMQGVHTAMQFFNDHRACKTQLLPPEKGDTRRRVAVHYHGGSAYGYEVSQAYRIFELRTFINENSMTGNRLRERKEGTAELLSEDTQKAFDELRALSAIRPEDDQYSLIDLLAPDQQELVSKQIQTESQKEMERQLAELRKTMDEEQAIRQYVCNNPVTYYVNRYGEHVKTEDPKFCELHVRLRVSEYKRLSEQDFLDMVTAFSKRVGSEMSKSWRNALHPIYTTGYYCGWAAAMNWTVTELPAADTAPLHDFKHKMFVDFKTSVEEWMADDYDDRERNLFLRFATFGFDRGIAKASVIVGRTFNIRALPEQTAEEYLDAHSK